MSSSLTLGLAVAVLLFWAVGAYNRLVRLRACAIDAFMAMDEQFRLYGALVQSGLTPRDGEAPPAVLAGLIGAAGQFDLSLKAARMQPLDDLAVGALMSAYETLNEAWSRLRSEPPDLAGSPLPDALQQQWLHIEQQGETARGEFNRCVRAYNEAIDLFPARLLASLFRFKHAHTI